METRLYSFVNYYLSSIQQGIQTGHAAVDIVRKYTSDANLSKRNTEYQQHLVEKWADHDKTFIILNGGDSTGIDNATRTISANNTFPWSIFKESSDSLSGIQTCVSVIVPAYIFDVTKQYDTYGNSIWVHLFDTSKQQVFNSTHVHYDLINLIKSCKLAS